jgi:hypothetical protein
MHPMDSVPAIRRLDTGRTDLLAIEIAGAVTGADVENLYGLLEGAYALHDRIDLLVRWPEAEHVDWQQVARETVEEARDHASRHIRRCAAIGGRGDVSALLRALGSDSAAEYRRFAEDQEDEAWAWIEAEPAA